MTFYPLGDPAGGADGYSGSLFSVSHVYQNYISEFTIPAPYISPTKDTNELPRAVTLQPFVDVADGRQTGGLTGSTTGDIQYFPKQGNWECDKLLWTMYEYYMPPYDACFHGWCNVNFSNLNSVGLWRLGDYPAARTSKYLFKIPEFWADQFVQSRIVGAGRYRTQNGGSMGPCFVGGKGYHSGPYYGALLFYDPQIIAESARSNIAPSQVQPYAVFNVHNYLYDNLKCDLNTLGACGYDKLNQLYYVVEQDVEGFWRPRRPIVHIFRIINSGLEPDRQAPTNAVFNTTTGAFSWQTQTGDEGIYRVTFSVTDSKDTDTEEIALFVYSNTVTRCLLTIECTGPGTGIVSNHNTGSRCTKFLQELIDEGTLVDLTALPDFTSTFICWDQNAVETNPVYQIEVTNHMTIRAQFSYLDTDADGIPDYWEQQYSGSSTALQAGVDSDRDGFINQDEWIADTVPTNTASLPIMNQVNGQSGYFSLEWPSSSNRIYQIYYSTDLQQNGSGFQMIADNIPGNPPQNNYSDTQHHLMTYDFCLLSH